MWLDDILTVFLLFETKSDLLCFSCQDPILQPGDRHYQGGPGEQDVQELRPPAQQQS